MILTPESSPTEPESSFKVLVIHRPKYDDWSFPKGKLNRGESIDHAALREVSEETGLHCRIVRPLTVCRYSYQSHQTGVQQKAVHYFVMEPVNLTVSVDGSEVDRAEWLSLAGAKDRLTYKMDRETLDALVVKKAFL